MNWLEIDWMVIDWVITSGGGGGPVHASLPRDSISPARLSGVFLFRLSYPPCLQITNCKSYYENDEQWWAVMNESCRWSSRDLQCLFSAACIFRFNRSCGVRVDAYDNKRNIQTWLTHLLSLYLFLRLSFKSASGRRAGYIAPFYLPPLGSYRLNTWQLN